MELNKELVAKAKEAKTAEELIALAKGNGVELTAEEAKTYFARLNSEEGELADDELNSVAGGRKCGTIYKDGWPVVVDIFNGCDLYEERKGALTIPHLSNQYCDSCVHCYRDGILSVCKNPKRYEN